ncbi:uncharacterized protein JCM6883_005791 [Sporobolomyces salmoneus]|uniref:uncharacterized protein n=1 Tax=Sporobolomyces salmoneus TaxID=183962 RepID=UPI00317C8AA2
MTLDCQLDSQGNPKKEKEQKNARYVGCREQMEIKRVKQIETNSPDPWLSRKLAVGLAVGMFGYSYYVFVVRLCIPMIRMERDRLGARAQGLVYLVICHFLFVHFCWSYYMAITTSPGYARDYVPKTDPPSEEAEYITVAGQRFEDQPMSPKMLRQSMDRPSTDVQGEKNGQLEMREIRDETSTVSTRQPLNQPSTAAEEDVIAENAPAVGALGPNIATALTSAVSPPTSLPAHADGRPTSIHESRERHSSTSDTSGTAVSLPSTTIPSVPVPAHLSKPAPTLSPQSSRPSSSSFLHFPEPPEDYEPASRLKVERIPPFTPVLKLQYRYDPREGIVRPFRSHRCRHCAAIVLKMDHHCPWVGSCVGARNYKYFYHSLQSSTFYLLFLFLSLLIAQTLPLSSFTPSQRPYPGVDGHQIAIIALSFLFLIFTGSLFAAHTRLILRNMTTIEEIGVNRMRQKERNALQSVYGFWNFRAKRETREAWVRRWGRLGKEGNLWWLGSNRKNWEMVMGQHKLGWIFPIPAKPTHDDGLHYVPNPRFDKDGVWRPRKDWPVELRELGLKEKKS